MPGIYARILRLYPARCRREFADEMTSVFEAALTDVRGQNSVARLRFYVRESLGLVCGALREHFREFKIGRFRMRGEFRFPKATWILMTLILAGVIVAIEMGQAISASVPDPGPAIPPIMSSPHTLVGGIAVLSGAMYVLGLLAGGILFMLRRKAEHT